LFLTSFPLFEPPGCTNCSSRRPPLPLPLFSDSDVTSVPCAPSLVSLFYSCLGAPSDALGWSYLIANQARLHRPKPTAVTAAPTTSPRRSRKSATSSTMPLDPPLCADTCWPLHRLRRPLEPYPVNLLSRNHADDSSEPCLMLSAKVLWIFKLLPPSRFIGLVSTSRSLIWPMWYNIYINYKNY
jgi:hypothetical protein